MARSIVYAAAFAVLVTSGWAAAEDGMGQAGSNVSGLLEDEAALTLMMLHAENGELKEKVARLEDEIEILQRRLADALSKLDLEKIDSGESRRVEQPAPADVSLDDVRRLRVLDVNREMDVVVISGGLRAGMKTGMEFSVVRGDEVIATVKLVDVRERIAGGLIEETYSGRFPETGDRLVLSEAQDR